LPVLYCCTSKKEARILWTCYAIRWNGKRNDAGIRREERGKGDKEKIDEIHEVTNEAGGTKRRDSTKETIEKACHELTAQCDKTQFFCPHLNVSVNITIKKFHTCCTISEELYKKLKVAKRTSIKHSVYPQVGL